MLVVPDLLPQGFVVYINTVPALRFHLSANRPTIIFAVSHIYAVIFEDDPRPNEELKKSIW